MEKQKTIFNRGYILMILVNTLLFSSFNMINPVLPEYIISLGMNATLAGVIAGSFSITSLIVRSISGVAADRQNPKVLYMIAGMGIAIACASYSLCDGFWGFIIIRIFHGVFFAIATTVSLVIVSYYIPDGKMGEGIGLFGIGSIIAISFAPGMGLKMNAAYGAEQCFILAAAMSFFATICIICVPFKKQKHDTKGKIERRKFSMKNFIASEVIIFAFLSGLFSFSNSIEYSFISLYSKTKGISDISLYFTVSAGFIFLSRLFAGKIYDKKGLSVVLYPAFAVVAFSMFLLGSADFLWMFMVAAALKSLGQGAAQPSLQSHCIISVDKDRVGVASSTYYLGPDIMQGIGPVVGGFIIDNAGYETAYYLCGSLLLIGMLIYTIFTKNIRTSQK